MEYARNGFVPLATVLPMEPSDHLDHMGIQHFPLDVTSEKSILELKANLSVLTGSCLAVLVNNAYVTVPVPESDMFCSVIVI